MKRVLQAAIAASALSLLVTPRHADAALNYTFTIFDVPSVPEPAPLAALGAGLLGLGLAGRFAGNRATVGAR